MLINIRCFSCKKPVARHWNKFQARLEESRKNGEDEGQARKNIMDELGFDRVCCRQTIMGHVDNMDLITKFKKH